MKHLLSSSAFLVVNKFMAKEIGLNATILLSDLISKEQYFIENGTISNGWFFNTASNIEKDTTLTHYQQKKAIETLENLYFIETKLKGLPAKLHFKILEKNILTYLNTSIKETSKLDLKKVESNNNKIIKTTNKDLLKGRFGEEVSNLSAEIGMSIEDANEFLSYWTEPNRSGTKMRFELQKTWETKRRLLTWQKNTKKFNKSTSKIDKQLDEYLKGKELL
tara:strand:+ start:73 stop:735 length:663 start_codon:yes stop_codon:yes gene_type:complete